MICDMPVGVLLAGCLYVTYYLLLFVESLLYRDFMKEHYATLTRRPPVFGVNDLNVYSAVSFAMCLSSILLLLGMILKRNILIWPWILLAFHNCANYSYLMLEYFFWWKAEGAIDKILHVCPLPTTTFVLQVLFFYVSFSYFRRLISENHGR